VSVFTPEGAVEAFSFMAAYRRNQEWLLEVPPPQPEMPAPDLKAALRVHGRALAAGRVVLSIGETQVLLAAFGVTMPQAVVTTVESAQAVARSVGYPVALQLEVEGDAGPVRARLRSSAAVARAFTELSATPQPNRRKKRAVVVRGESIPRSIMPRRSASIPTPCSPVIAFGSASARATELSIMLPPPTGGWPAI
jgi:acetyltransferase